MIMKRFLIICFLSLLFPATVFSATEPTLKLLRQDSRSITLEFLWKQEPSKAHGINPSGICPSENKFHTSDMSANSLPHFTYFLKLPPHSANASYVIDRLLSFDYSLKKCQDALITKQFLALPTLTNQQIKPRSSESEMLVNVGAPVKIRDHKLIPITINPVYYDAANSIIKHYNSRFYQ